MDNEREAFEKAAQQFADEHLKDEMHILYYEVCAMAFKGGWQARARVGKGEVERRKAIAGLHGCRLAARGEYCASCVIQATNYEYQGEEDRRSKPHDYALSLARARVGKGEVERDSISAEEIKGWRLDPKVHDAILNRADPFSVAWHQREKEHQAALSAKAKPIEVGEVETHITDMAIAHDMSHTAFCDEGHWRDEFIAAKEKAIAGLSSKPVEADKELARLKRLVEVLSNLKFAIIQAMFTLNSIGDATDLERVKKAANHEYLKLESALEALAAADRIAKGEV